MNAGAPKFNDPRAHSFKRSEVELSLTVVAKMPGGDIAHLQAVGADDLLRLLVLDDEVIADRVVAIGVVPILERRREPFVHLEIEDEEAQTEGSSALLRSDGKPYDVRARFHP